MFHRDYMEYHADRFTDASLIVEDESGKAVAVFPASKHDDRLVSHGGLTFGGLVISDRMGARKTLEALAAVMVWALSDGAATLHYKVVPHIYHRAPNEEDLYALFRANALLVRRDISAAIDLGQRMPYSKGRRSSIKQVPADVAVELSTDYSTFMEIEAEALERHGASATHTAEEMSLLAARFPKNIRLYLARRDGIALAGVVVYDTPQVRHTQYIGATTAGKQCGAADAVLDHLIQDAAGTHRWFDFGISTEIRGRYLNEGLASNKESYGARGIAYDQYEVACTPDAIALLTNALRGHAG
jgi:hypothetical protein